MENKEAEDELYMKGYSEMIYRIAYTVLKSKSDAEDTLQEVLIKYVTTNKKFKDEEYKKRWLIRVTLNMSYNLKKSAWKRHTVPLEDEIKFEHKYQDEIFDIIERLDKKYKDVVCLYYYEDVPIKEISKILKISEDNVRKRLSRARKKLELLYTALRWL